MTRNPTVPFRPVVANEGERAPRKQHNRFNSDLLAPFWGMKMNKEDLNEGMISLFRSDPDCKECKRPFVCKTCESRSWLKHLQSIRFFSKETKNDIA